MSNRKSIRICHDLHVCYVALVTSDQILRTYYAMPAKPQNPTSAILHQSPTSTTVLIDIPLSLALAQHLSPPPPFSDQPLSLPLSTSAPSEPYPSTEPKSDKARQRVIERLGVDANASIDEAWIREGLKDIKKGYQKGCWCSPRYVIAVARKRKRGEDDHEAGDKLLASSRDDLTVIDALGSNTISHDPILGDKRMRPDQSSEGTATDVGIQQYGDPVLLPEPCLRSSTLGNASWEAAKHNSESTILSAESPGAEGLAWEFMLVKEAGNRLISNQTQLRYFLTLLVSRKQGSKAYPYYLPPFSSFMLSNINAESAKTFSESAYAVLPKRSTDTGAGQFDFVLLDPPWNNRSVRRSKRYRTLESQHHDTDPIVVLEEILGQHIAPGGLVGCWITNKASVREKALRLFDTWGVELEQEWVWLKVTSKGEPVTELDGLWRKPYEVLLLGRKVAKDAMCKKGAEGGKKSDMDVERRLIVAIPDLHSRKPNLKDLIEPMISDRKNYRALEVFARNLTAGWWAWGDECLKYNWMNSWITTST